ncbi:hypothetical protein OHA18_37320 [Kribbella sp. NBC_00709]|uniref:hypothetical protein n=1 Tax=Kribbella sp. NBC_00709 TaxID=2975972 RepID=UPI002E2928BD|nr:hypothetical protein [Kribbella sp. NBC_00709]
MRPEKVEIKVTLADAHDPAAAARHVEKAIERLELQGGDPWTVVFCEDITDAAASTALLDIGVVLRVRGKTATAGDSTIKLRPSRWSQLDPEYFENVDADGDNVEDLKIEADWAGEKRSLAASMTVKWSDSRLATASADGRPVTELFSKKQLDFLATCSVGRVNLAAVSMLPPITATRFEEFTIDGLTSKVRGERWRVDGLDFLELSIVAKPKAAVAAQAALTAFMQQKQLPVDDSQVSKTRRVLEHLIAKSTI